MSPQLRRVFFSNHWESGLLQKTFEVKKYCPGHEGIWKNLQACDSIDDADIVVVNDSPRAEDIAAINTFLAAEEREVWWFTREPPLHMIDPSLYDGTFRKKINNPLFPLNLSFYHYPEDNFPLPGVWHLPDNYDYYHTSSTPTKKHKISALFSSKGFSPVYAPGSTLSSEPTLGYTLRQGIIESTLSDSSPSAFRDVHVYGRASDWAKNKSPECPALKGSLAANEKYKPFRDYDYSIVIENSSVRNYFTEKLLDCFLEETVPLYWGCPNILNYFPSDAIITLKDEDVRDPVRFAEIIGNLESPSKKRRLALKEAKRLVLDEYNIWEVLHKISCPPQQG